MIHDWSPEPSFLTVIASSHTVTWSDLALRENLKTHTILEPDKFQRASTIAVHTLSLVLSNDTVFERSSLLQEEDSISITLRKC
jgi:hypothetical protein